MSPATVSRWFDSATRPAAARRCDSVSGTKSSGRSVGQATWSPVSRRLSLLSHYAVAGTEPRAMQPAPHPEHAVASA